MMIDEKMRLGMDGWIPTEFQLINPSFPVTDNQYSLLSNSLPACWALILQQHRADQVFPESA